MTVDCIDYNYLTDICTHDLRNAIPSGYKLRLVFYAQGPSDGTIQLASGHGELYEIGKFYLKLLFQTHFKLKLINLIIHLFR